MVLTNKSSLFVAFLILFAVLFAPYIWTGYTASDDMHNALMEYNDFVDYATSQGRIYFLFLHGIVALWAHKISPMPLLKIVTILVILSNILSFGFLVKRLTFSDTISWATMFLWVLTLKDYWDFYLITTSPLLYTLPLTLFFNSLTLLVIGIGKSNYKYIFLSSLLYFISIQFSEIFITLYVLYLYILFTKNSWKKFRIKSASIITLPMVLYLMAYVSFRKVYPSHYDGNTIALSSKTLFDSIKTLWYFSTSSFPGIKYSEILTGERFSAFSPFTYLPSQNTNPFRAFVYILKNLGELNPIWPMLTIYAILFPFIILKTKNYKPSIKSLGILLFILGLIFFPNLPYCLTAKHRSWALEYNIRLYVGSYVSSFGHALLIAFLLYTAKSYFSHKFKFVLNVMIVITLVPASFIALATNQIIIKSKRISHLKWYSVDRFIETTTFQNMLSDSYIYAPSLFTKNIGSAIIHPTFWGFENNYWTEYILNKTGKKVGFIWDNEGLYNLFKHKRIFYLKYTQGFRGEEQFLFLSKIHKIESNINGDNPNIYGYNVDVFSIKSLPEYILLYNINGKTYTRKISHKNNVNISSHQLIHLNSISYSPDTDFHIPAPMNDDDTIVSFSNEFYWLEEEANRYWRWSQKNSSIRLYCSHPLNVKIRLLLYPGFTNNNKVEISLGNTKKEFTISEEGTLVEEVYHLTEGINTLHFKSKGTSITFPPNGDKRELYFRVENFNYTILK
ncbi:MAG: hypothetical protein H7A23_01100 [Leptospiraceae bacterium]|nr:hypothetical protein [Leptospiraceae bacterium]MCP5493128.1 hypothetical protein [Leptospiraceae bacterium]